MARFLFVVPPLAGHINPTAAVGAALLDSGHEVAWSGPGEELDHALPSGTTIFPVPRDVPAGLFKKLSTERPDLRGAAALKNTWDLLTELALAMIPGVGEAVDDFRPDVIVSDQHTFAGAVVARSKGVPWATSASTALEFEDPLAGLPKVVETMKKSLVDLQVGAGIPASVAQKGDLRFSDDLVISYVTEDLLIREGPWPDHYLFVGPTRSDRPAADFPWEKLSNESPKVMVSVGTVNQRIGERFLNVAVEAIAELDVQGIVVCDSDLFPDPPSNLIIEPWVPMLELLPKVDAIVTHGGINVMEALAVGLPQVLAPIRDDQSVTTAQAVAAGAAIRVKFGRVRTAQLSAAIDAILTEPQYRQAAQRVQQSFAHAGGAPNAAQALAQLAVGAGGGTGR